MSCGHEGNDVCTNLLPREFAAGVRVTCASEQHQDIVFRTGFLPLEIGFPCCNHVLYRLVEHANSGTRGEAG
jgi:hypothetical protein